jgi:predicted MFS family arabinose efflux permease
MIGKAGMICGLSIIVGGVIGGLFGEKELGYEIGTAACIVIMGVAVLLSQKNREKNRKRV